MGMKRKIELSDAQLNQLSQDQLVAMYRVLHEKYTEVEKQLDFLTERLSLANRERFGASSEKLPYAEGARQLDFFNDVELEADSKSLIGKAINYALNQQEYLQRFLTDGNIAIDNNATENAIRPFVRGRRAWLFCNTPNGAKASAMVYSIVETVKANGLHVYNYLTHVFETMPRFMNGTSREFIQDLLPWSDSILEKCRVKRVDSK